MGQVRAEKAGPGAGGGQGEEGTASRARGEFAAPATLRLGAEALHRML